ncbi:MAG TPA: serine--tRNA ligase [Gemmatimonadaceae bacterium]|nr:serine--tRNA ligase [Gemmatimonadaceae bacterium]
MHDLRVIREQLDVLRDGMRRRGALDAYSPAIDRAEKLDRERRLMIQAVEERKAQRNANSQEVARRKKAKEDADALIAHGRALGDEIATLEGELGETQRELDALLLEIPNVPLADVPPGGEEHNQVTRTWGEPRAAESVRPHWEVGASLGLLDLERGAKIAGSGFVVFRGAGARLVRALMSYMVDLHTREHGYEEVWVPFVANAETMRGTGQLPKFADDMYALQADGLYLIPTAEVPITNLYRDEMLDGAALPRGFVGYSPCFRREAGSHGKDTRGLIRVHQFDKVEIVRYAAPEDSAAQHELLTRHAETVLQQLGLPYRVVLLAGGDMGFSSAKTYDLEVFAPGVGKWLEVSSCSNFLDFQARRANIRYRPGPGEKPRLVHTLNGSGLAFPRTIIAILEHCQQPDGSVRVPEVIRPYLGTDRLG